jgi:tRNA pseudouridine38-40 synthase
VKRFKKRKVAVFFAYLGEGYHGMQRNPGVRTIEDAMEDALYQAGCISDANRGELSKIGWMRSARTDKGVNAVGQVVSAKLVIEPTETLVERINAALPPGLACLGYHRVTAGFCARKMCDRRRYEYVLPAWALDPALGRRRADVAQADGGAGVAAAEDGEAAEEKPAEGGAAPEAPAADGGAAAEAHPLSEGDAAIEKPAVPWTPEEGLAKLNSALAQYVGTRNYHNYTKGMDPKLAQAKRNLLSFKAELFDFEGEPLVRCVVLGQSFVLHQIRKMIGMALAVARGVADEACLTTALRTTQKCNVPLAPELGLFLDETIFHAYNKRYTDTHKPLDCSEFTDQVAKFKKGLLYPHIVKCEARDGPMKFFVRGLNEENYSFSKWLEFTKDLK